MRVGKELIAATKPYSKDRPAQSWWCILSTLVLLALTLGVAGTSWPLLVRSVASVLAGLLVLRLFVIYHDQQHHAILPRSRSAELLMRVVGVLFLSPSSVWRSSHNHHHNHNSKLRGSHIGAFPVMTKTQYLRSSRLVRIKYLLMRHPLTILAGYLSVFLCGMCVLPLLDKTRRRVDCLLALVIHLVIVLLLTICLGWQGLILVLVVPFFIAGAIGSYLFYAQHNFPAVSLADANGWTYEKAALESSSRMEMGPVMSWFTANIGHHHIHHLNSRIPFYRLPEVFRAIPELQDAKTTSLHLAEITRCLRLKLWDVEAQKMITLAQLRKN